MTTIMNNNVSVNDYYCTNDPTNILKGIENGVCTIKCVATTSSIDTSGDYRITRRLECLWTNQGTNAGDKILDLEISGTKGTTPVVTVNGQVIPSNSLALDGTGNLEVRSFKGMLLDIVKLPNEYSMSPAGLDMNHIQNGANQNAASVLPAAKPFLGIAVKPVSADLAHNLAIDPRNVCVISEVVPGSPAFASGLEPNDVLLGINNKQANLSNLRHDLGTAKAGQPVKLVVLCKGVKREMSVTLGAFGWANQQTQIKPGFKYPGNAVDGTVCQGTGAQRNGEFYTNESGYPLGLNSPTNVETTWMSVGALI